MRKLRAKITRQQDAKTGQELYNELAQAIGVSVSDVVAMYSRLGGKDISLNEPIDHEGDSIAERQDQLICDAPLPDALAMESVDLQRQNQRIAVKRAKSVRRSGPQSS